MPKSRKKTSSDILSLEKNRVYISKFNLLDTLTVKENIVLPTSKYINGLRNMKLVVKKH